MAANTDEAAKYPGPVLLTLRKDDGRLQVGLLPAHERDRYDDRAITVARINNISNMVCSPDGDLYIVRDGNLYVGQTPGNENADWFAQARLVGRRAWGRCKHIFFHPNGEMWLVDEDGALYKGPPPDNPHINWQYGKATMIGRRGWEQFDKLCFNPGGDLFGVINTDKLRKGIPPSGPDDPWLIRTYDAGMGGWRNLTHFMAFSPDGNLWTVRRDNGNLYRGSSPGPENLQYLNNATKLGENYTQYRFLCLTQDKTIHSFISFEFLPDQGRVLNETAEVVKHIVCDNRRSNSILRESFEFSKTIRQSSSFNHEHGFGVEVGVETTFKVGIPIIAENETTISMNMSTNHTWNFEETNETEVTFSSNSELEVEPGKAIRVVASVKRAEMNIPYQAIVRTKLGFETTIKGTWNGVSHYNMTVTQEDYTR